MPSEFKFQIIDEIDLDLAVDQINAKSSSGYDGISSQTLKKVYPSIKSPLLALINDSLSHGIFPDELKLAKITPIYKNKGSKDEMKNYRPISLLPSISKIFEKVVYKQIYNHFQKFDLFLIPNKVTLASSRLLSS